MGAATARIEQVARVGPRRVGGQHVVAHRQPDLGHEHGAAVHEGALCEDPRPSREQQLLRREHQHRPRRLGVVRCAQRLLGQVAEHVRKK